ncbi:hypothetical protein F4780DRAFT_682978 [Xylariomycetidae sp. FL0641]|nr:hypothetical protein F4780DRAFT_682978 [Xylariomycetidae sp. FL0641]
MRRRVLTVHSGPTPQLEKSVKSGQSRSAGWERRSSAGVERGLSTIGQQARREDVVVAAPIGPGHTAWGRNTGARWEGSGKALGFSWGWQAEQGWPGRAPDFSRPRHGKRAHSTALLRLVLLALFGAAPQFPPMWGSQSADEVTAVRGSWVKGGETVESTPGTGPPPPPLPPPPQRRKAHLQGSQGGHGPWDVPDVVGVLGGRGTQETADDEQGK